LDAARDPRQHRGLRHAALVGIGRAMAGTRDATFARALASSLGSDFELHGAVAIALARIGGAVARDALLGSLRSGRKSLDVPWAALALGILEDDRRRAGDSPDP